MVDTLNSTGPVLLAVLAASLALSNAQIGFALTLYTLLGALSQPVFGWLADRSPIRLVVLAGVGAAWMIGCYTLVALATTWAALLPFLLLAALGSGLFHPVGTASAVAAAPLQAGSTTALFFFCGQLGLALGPMLGGSLFRAYGTLGLLPLCLIAVPPMLLLLATPQPALPVAQSASRAATHGVLTIVLAFVVLVALRSAIQATYAAFLPKLFADRGWEASTYGVLAGTFLLTAACGNIGLGLVADRYGMRAATVWPLLGGVPAGLLCVWAPTHATAFMGAALAGLLIGGQHSVLVVHAQRLIPARHGFAAGLILGFTFAAGAGGVWLSGLLADRWGLAQVMAGVTWLAVPAALLALTLPGRARAARAGPAAMVPDGS